MQETQGFLLDDGANGTPETVSKRGFAELVRVSPGRVSQMIAAGLPVEPNGRIAVAKGRDWMRTNIDPSRMRASLGDSPAAAAVPTSARHAREIEEAKIARFKAEKLAGNLIDRKSALVAIESRARAERDAWIGWVNRVAPEIAAAVGAEIAPIIAVIDRMVREQLAALSETPIERLHR